MKNLYTILLRPVVTEKSMQAQAARKYTFMVSQDANKIDVQQAVTALYNTEVEAVNMVKIRSKIRLLGRSKIMTKRQNGQKAVVTLRAGKTIDVMKIHEEKKTSKKESSKKETKA